MNRQFARGFLFVFACLLVVGAGGWYVYNYASKKTAKVSPPPPAPALNPFEKPKLKTEVVLKGLTNPWDVGFLPDKTMLFTERGGQISMLKGGQKVVLGTVPDVQAKGESGLMGLAIDPDFTDTRFIYACYSTATDIRVGRWKLADVSAGKLGSKTDIVTSMPYNIKTFPGRHSGCQLAFGPDKFLWIGTGDVAIGTNPQNPQSLGGKILRVDRTGQPAPGNLGAPYDPRIFSYGHRNTQGLALYKTKHGDIYGYSVEHGSSIDDEVNPLVSGNFGWDPIPGYNESVVMTDHSKFPNAIDAVWSSGTSTIAPSGATILDSAKWQLWNGRLAMSVLKGKELLVMKVDGQNKTTEVEPLFKDQFGRIRAAEMGPDGSLYVTTDNGSQLDTIIKVTPQ